MPILAHDQLHRFLLERAGVRGALVRLGPSWREVAGRGDYPRSLRDLLGQALAASALLTAHIKLQGSLSIELKSQGPLRLLFAECSDAGHIRGLARWEAPLSEPLDLGAQPGALLAITLGSVEQGTRYQGLVSVRSVPFATLLEDYFAQSEQLPTRIMLASDADGAAGLLLQQLPGERGDDDAWNRVGHLTATLTEAELLALPADELLRRLYHEETPRLLDVSPLGFGCGCSRDRVEAVLRALGRAEVEAALAASGDLVEVTCEFCNAHYRFDPVDVARVVSASPSAPASATPH
jgi:molecular chaperone Hsp33